jgi:hypothetical protein
MAKKNKERDGRKDKGSRGETMQIRLTRKKRILERKKR